MDNAIERDNGKNKGIVKTVYRKVSDKVNVYKAMLRDRIKEDIETFKENEKNYKELKKEKNKIKENIFEEVRKF
ncbi:MAG: hypothetical protein M1331_02730, partial [Candidatus Marsarchaeota archaeon]|nr:hypothetical protein [Candidatus Marsarchaeota archaeon]